MKEKSKVKDKKDMFSFSKENNTHSFACETDCTRESSCSICRHDHVSRCIQGGTFLALFGSFDFLLLGRLANSSACWLLETWTLKQILFDVRVVFVLLGGFSFYFYAFLEKKRH